MQTFEPIAVKSEPLSLDVTPGHERHCQAPRQRCTQPRAVKPDGTLHALCAQHRRHAQRRDQQRQRLLRVLLDALRPEDEEEGGDSAPGTSARRRPRLVLLGNQQTLILGVVLSEQRGATVSRIARSML